MPRWSSQSAWKKLSRRLASEVNRRFERAVLPCLRVLWPALEQTPPKSSWDRKGIDLITWTDAGPFDCVVQCKGYEVRDLGSDQLYKARESIKAFRESDVRARTYLFVHNQSGKDREFHSKIRDDLDGLVRANRVENAELWNRQEMLDKVFDEMRIRLDLCLRKSAENLLVRYQKLFDFTLPYVAVVPVTESELVFQRYEPCRQMVILPRTLRNIESLLLLPDNTRWTLFVGVFGSGKTTTALHTALSTDYVPIFVQATTLSSSQLRQSTNVLLEEVVKSLQLLDEDFQEEDFPVLEEIAGSVLGYLLRCPKSEYLLVLDGLDENRVYSKLEGLQHLNNQLAEFSCPVIMTTRKEHLGEMFGDFSLAFYEFSAKYGPNRSARLIELEPWEESNVTEVVNKLSDQLQGLMKVHLLDFLDFFRRGEHKALYGDLPLNPLFLQFLLDDILSEGIRKAGRAELIRSWVRRKIRRDRTIPKRISPDSSLDIEEFVERMLTLLENVAGEMIARLDGGFELTELIESSRVREHAISLFPNRPESILGILLNSVLVPQGFRKGHMLKVFFAFRILQEFFLAFYLRREHQSVTGYPEGVAAFYREAIDISSGS